MAAATTRARKARATRSDVDDSLPHDLEVERLYLGSMMCGGNDERIEAKHFVSSFHAAMWTSIVAVRKDELHPIDAVVVSRHMTANGAEWEFHQMRAVLDCAIHEMYVGDYADILIDLWRRRRMIRATDFLVRRAYDPTASVEETWEKVNNADL